MGHDLRRPVSAAGLETLVRDGRSWTRPVDPGVLWSAGFIAGWSGGGRCGVRDRVAWGAVAGYVGGRLDGVMMRFVDVLYSLPSIIFVIVLLTTLKDLARTWFAGHFGKLGLQLAAGTPMLLLFAGLGAVSWLTMARIVRGQVLSLRTRAFVDASRALGPVIHASCGTTYSRMSGASSSCISRSPSRQSSFTNHS